MKFDVILHKEDNGYWAEVPALKGCYTQGDTIDEIKDNIKEAITAWLSVDLSDTKEEIISIAL
ncbi:TPA: HicB family protein [Candidatus Gastranaerophilales bacterium HUM_2]|nr:MAG TPA: HicB family protein [Candidatus Gastranaerophilales bacterium HUM_2]